MKTKVIIVTLGLFGLFGSAAAQRRPKDMRAEKLVTLYREIDSLYVPNWNKPMPLIGISSGAAKQYANVALNYAESVSRAGGVPVIIPCIADANVMRKLVADLDGIILTGGEDVEPAYYGESKLPACGANCAERDRAELALLKMATDRNIPLLGICRGMQLINIAFGGTLYQDIPSQHGERGVNHLQQLPRTEATHRITTVEGSVAQNLFGKEAKVNSLHHQAIHKLAPHFVITAYAPDSIAEAIEGYPNKNIMGVQFHPEGFVGQEGNTLQRLFPFFIQKAALYHKAKEVHNEVLSIDTHTDAPMWFARGLDISTRATNQVNLPKMEEGHLDAQFLAAFVGQKKLTPEGREKAKQDVIKMIDAVKKQAALHSDLCEVAYNERDAQRIKAAGKKAFFLGIENGYALGLDLKNIAFFKQMGVNYVTLCHSYDNDICHSSTHSEDSSKGLTAYGKQVVKELNKQGIMIDLSHASEGTFWDVMKLSKKPVFCSHSSARALCGHDRNLTDNQLRALAKNGGVIQLCVLDAYIDNDEKKADLMRCIDHIDHIVKVAGIDHVGIGSDFDGGGGVWGMNGDNDMIQITVKLLEKGYTHEQLRKLWGGNFYRVMNEVQKK